MYFLYYKFWVLNRGRGDEGWGQEREEEEETERRVCHCVISSLSVHK
jgi:hypothetical protein